MTAEKVLAELVRRGIAPRVMPDAQGKPTLFFPPGVLTDYLRRIVVPNLPALVGYVAEAERMTGALLDAARTGTKTGGKRRARKAA